MLSRRDKLYVQPWEDRRFQDHRAKVLMALPAIDAGAPTPRAHVAVKLKKCQREDERARRIQRDNYSLLQRLAAIMRAKRLDNCWDIPLPNFRHKVGVFYAAAALRGRVAARAQAARPAAPRAGAAHVKCFACDTNRKNVQQLNKVYGARGDSLPSV